MELPINSDTGLAVVVSFLVIKEFLNVIKKFHPKEAGTYDQRVEEAIVEVSKAIAIQTEILRGISESQKEMYRRMLETPSCKNYELAQ